MLKKLILAAIYGFIFIASTFAYEVNEKVQIEWKSKWYKGKIEKIDNNKSMKKYYISYEGYNAKWNEWVGERRLRAYDTPIKKVVRSTKKKDCSKEQSACQRLTTSQKCTASMDPYCRWTVNKCVTTCK